MAAGTSEHATVAATMHRVRCRAMGGGDWTFADDALIRLDPRILPDLRTLETPLTLGAPPGISYRIGRIEVMIFTTKAEYGVRLLVELGRQGSGQPVSLKAISEAEGLPLAYLERIVALLKKAALVESTRGAHGGYRLSRPAESITMDEVVLALEGAVAPMSCFVDDSQDGRVLCSHVDDHGHACATKLLWTRVQGGVIKALAHTTLAELVAFSDRSQLSSSPTATVAV